MKLWKIVMESMKISNNPAGGCKVSRGIRVYGMYEFIKCVCNNINCFSKCRIVELNFYVRLEDRFRFHKGQNLLENGRKAFKQVK